MLQPSYCSSLPSLTLSRMAPACVEEQLRNHDPSAVPCIPCASTVLVVCSPLSIQSDWGSRSDANPSKFEIDARARSVCQDG